MAERVPVITIDGPSGSGKGVLATHLAMRKGFHLLDSGALYRLTGLAARQQGMEPGEVDEARFGAIAAGLDVTFEPTGDPENPLEMTLAGEVVTGLVRTDQAGEDASRLAALPAVRRGLLALQRTFRRLPGLVADGRDMGTVVFPDADVKIFLTASTEARAQRRYNQLKHKDIGVSLQHLLQSIRARDKRDMSRQVSPLRPADDAFVIDSTGRDLCEVLNQAEAIVMEKTG